MTQQSHCWAYIWRKTWFDKINDPNVHFSAVYNSQDMEAT